jgi:dipeptidyl-peptidase-4
MGVTELADQKAGVDYLTSLGFVDADRIGIFGWSYGGFMTLNAMLYAPGTFRAGVAGAPVTNFVNYDTIYTERYMGLPAENPDGYKRTNLSLAAPNLKGSLMIIHNFQDDNVLFQNTLQMVDALEKADKKFELMLYTQKTHGVTGPVRRQMLQSILDFLIRAQRRGPPALLPPWASALPPPPALIPLEPDEGAELTPEDPLLTLPIDEPELEPIEPIPREPMAYPPGDAS